MKAQLKLMEKLETVSYTHLDVYKRQGDRKSTGSFCRQNSSYKGERRCGGWRYTRQPDVYKRQMATEAGIELEETEEYSKDVAAGLIIEQQDTQGTSIEKGSSVKVTSCV